MKKSDKKSILALLLERTLARSLEFKGVVWSTNVLGPQDVTFNLRKDNRHLIFRVNKDMCLIMFEARGRVLTIFGPTGDDGVLASSILDLDDLDDLLTWLDNGVMTRAVGA